MSGVWVTYLWDWNVIVDSVYADELTALRAATDSGYLKVAFIEFGQTVTEACNR